MKNDIARYSRQTGLIHPNKLQIPITIVGAGGIGSWTTLALAKLGCENLTVYDFDEVETQNIAPQVYSSLYVGMDKVAALREMVKNLTDVEITAKNERFLAIPPQKYDILISAVDNMEARKKMFEINIGVPIWFIDGRMAANVLHVYTIKMDNEGDVAFYQGTLFTDEEADPVPCTERSVSYNVLGAASLISDIVAKIGNKQKVPRELILDFFNFKLFS